MHLGAPSFLRFWICYSSQNFHFRRFFFCFGVIFVLSFSSFLFREVSVEVGDIIRAPYLLVLFWAEISLLHI